MARATGGDVILELMTSVAELKAAMANQATRVEKLSEDVKGLGVDMHGNVEQFGRIATLLAAFADKNAREHEELESRSDVLERKASGQ
jgi:hypothetical protein